MFKSIKVSLLQIQEKERKKANKKHWKLQGRRKKNKRAARAGNLVSQESQKHAEQSGDGPFKESWLEIGHCWFRRSHQFPAWVSLKRVTEEQKPRTMTCKKQMGSTLGLCIRLVLRGRIQAFNYSLEPLMSHSMHVGSGFHLLIWHRLAMITKSNCQSQCDDAVFMLVGRSPCVIYLLRLSCWDAENSHILALEQ